jgi:glycosyltransferase involved in cell wall biosynthesis
MTVETTRSTGPTVSFALPVRNGAETISAAIESVQAQTLEDWELVISDNHSTDGTSEICASYAAHDPRIRHVPTERSLSQNGNFTQAFHLTRGVYFRWYGDDDWLEPAYAERTVAALEAEPDAVLCTTLQRYYKDGRAYPLNDAANRLPGVRAADPVQRVIQFLHLIERAGWFGVDPVYSLARRSAVAQSGLISPYRFGDFIFSCEMAVLGPFTHVPEALAHRGVSERVPHSEALRRFTDRWDWTRYVQREISLLRVWEIVGSSTKRSRLPLVPILVGYALREHWHGLRRRLRRVAQGRGEISGSAQASETE